MTRKNSQSLFVAAAAAVLGLAASRPSLAATIRDDTPDSQYIALSAQSQYAASGYVTVNTTGSTYVVGSGTLIAPDWILTAASIVTQLSGGSTVAFPASKIDFGQGATDALPGPNAVSQVITAPNWTFNNVYAGNDLALLKLSTPITTVAPANLYHISLGAETGQTATIIGYGNSGNGLTGQNAGTAGTRRGIQNVIDAYGGATTTGGNGQQYDFSTVSSDISLTDFDQPGVTATSIMGNTSPLPLEGSSVQGDGGGGAFLTVNGQTYLAGVTSTAGNFDSKPFGSYGDYVITTRIAVADTMNFITANLATASTYIPGGGNSWSGTARWSNGAIPEFAGATANFTTAATAPTTVTLNTNWTVGSVTFNNTNSYTLAAGTAGTLTLDNGTNTAAITDTAGSQMISAPVALNSNAQLSVSRPGDLLTLSGTISGSGGVTISAGSVSFANNSTYTGGTTINSGAFLIISPTGSLPSGKPVVSNGSLTILAGSKAAPVVLGNSAGTGGLTGSGALSVGAGGTAAYVQLAGFGATTSVSTSTSTVSSLTIAAGSTLDITNNPLKINFGSSADPLAAVRGYLHSAYNKGNWQGTGLTSSTVQAQVAANAGTSNGVWAMGYADGNDDGTSVAAAGQLIIKPAIAGDANLDNKVDFNDLLVLAQNLGSTSGDWMHGDFNYDSIVDFNDLLILAQNLGKTNGTTPLGAELPASFEAQWQLAQAEVHAAGGAGSVPEPGALSLLCAGAAALLARRKRTKSATDGDVARRQTYKA